MQPEPDRVAESATDNPKLKYALLHIGKTGGTSLGTLIRKLKVDDPDLRISKLSHRAKLRGVARKRPNTRIGFVIRDPAARFVSAFNSRLRSGRPAHEHTWRAEEAIVYSFFPTANDLAEALCTEDERLKSASQFALKNIRHLRRGYEFHLGGIDQLEKLKDRIYFVCDLDDLDDQCHSFFSPLGVDEEKIKSRFEPVHQGNATVPLSDLAVRNLRKTWATEFEIYEYCRERLIDK